MSMQFGSEVEKMFDNDLARKDSWKEIIQKENKKFPKSASDTVVVDIDEDTNGSFDVAGQYPNEPSKYDDLCNKKRILKKVLGKVDTYSLCVVTKSDNKSKDSEVDPKACELFIVAEKEGATVPRWEWIISPGACDWLMDQA